MANNNYDFESLPIVPHEVYQRLHDSTYPRSRNNGYYNNLGIEESLPHLDPRVNFVGEPLHNVGLATRAVLACNRAVRKLQASLIKNLGSLKSEIFDTRHQQAHLAIYGYTNATAYLARLSQEGNTPDGFCGPDSLVPGSLLVVYTPPYLLSAHTTPNEKYFRHGYNLTRLGRYLNQRRNLTWLLRQSFSPCEVIPFTYERQSNPAAKSIIAITPDYLQ